MVCKSCGFEFDNGDNRTCPQCGAEVLLDNSEENSTIEHNKDNVVKPDKETENGVSKILRMISVATVSYTHLTLSIYQFNESVQQIIKKVDYDNIMHGVYSGTVDVKKISQTDLNWLIHK